MTAIVSPDEVEVRFIKGDIAHKLGIEALAELRTEEEPGFTRRCGCDKFQGFLFIWVGPR